MRLSALLLCIGCASGCLVSFNDYPLEERPAAVHSAGGAQAGASTGTGGGRIDSGGSGSEVSSAAGQAGALGQAGTAGQARTADELMGEAECETLMTGVASSNYIDSFEDGDRELLRNQGRDGHWYVISDGTGVVTPPSDNITMQDLSVGLPTGGSKKGFHITAQGFRGWGAAIRAEFELGTGTELKAYDVSAFRGIAFWARVEPESVDEIRFDVPAKGTHDGCTECNDHFGVAIRGITTDWRRYCVPFEVLRQSGFGEPKLGSFDPKVAYGVQFKFDADTRTDLWVDSLRFF